MNIFSKTGISVLSIVTALVLVGTVAGILAHDKKKAPLPNPTPAITATPTPAPSSPTSSLITYQENGKTVSASVGDILTFQVNSSGQKEELSSYDHSLLEDVTPSNSDTVQLKALKTGISPVSFTVVAACAANMPCPQYAILFQTTISIQASSK